MTNKLTDLQKIEMVQKYNTEDCNCADLARHYNVTRRSIATLLKRRGIKIKQIGNKKHTLNEHYFDKIDTEEKAYFLGLLYADGCNSNGTMSIGLIESDKLLLDKFNIELNSNNKLYFLNLKCKSINWNNQYVLKFYSKYLSNRLSELGCTSRKSLTLKFPTEEQVPFHLLKHFIRGMWDGDGHIGFGNYKGHIKCNGTQSINFVSRTTLTSTLDFCKSVKNFIKEEVDINCSLGLDSKNGITTKLSIGGNKQVIRFLDWLYKDATIYLDRKYNKYQELIKLQTS